jgi:hypothetical protein
MNALLIPTVALTLALAACGKEQPPAPAPKAAAPAPQAAPATPPAAPAGTLSQEDKEKMAKELIDAAKSSSKKGE